MREPIIERHRVRDDIEFYHWRGQRIIITLCEEVLQVVEVGDSLVKLSHDHLSDEYEVETYWIVNNVLHSSPHIFFHYEQAKAEFDKVTSLGNLICQNGQFILSFPQ